MIYSCLLSDQAAHGFTIEEAPPIPSMLIDRVRKIYRGH